jgi:TPR repeat protein
MMLPSMVLSNSCRSIGPSLENPIGIGSRTRLRAAQWRESADDEEGAGWIGPDPRSTITEERSKNLPVTDAIQAKTLTTLRREACEGQAQAQYALGKMYADLDPAPDKDIGRQQIALKWFLAAAEQGHAAAQHQLGLIYA